MEKWAIELNEFDIEYRPRPTMKAQVLVAFVAENTIPREGMTPETSEEKVDGP